MSKETVLSIILDEFLKIAQIPRPSHHEEKIGEYLLQWASDHGLPAVKDELGDVIIEKPASEGCEAAPRVILQAHMDMVCVAAEGVQYNPLTDPIQVINDGERLTAKGTSLGADDGIGVALCLYLLQDQTLRHGPIRVILTVNEEDGMDSCALDPKYLDADYLINLDWEWLGSLCNSSAGADIITLTRKADWMEIGRDQLPIRIQLKGLLGGHSGVDINRGRANALICLAAALDGLTESGIEYNLADFHGGQAKNAIPAFAEVTLAVAKEDFAKALECLDRYQSDFQAGFGDVETDGTFLIQSDSVKAERTLSGETSRALVSLLLTLPGNVHTMSPFVPSLTESSQNIGQLSMEGGVITLSGMERSCVRYRAKELLRATELIAETFGFQYILGEHAPAWAVNPKSKLTPITCEAYRQLTGKDMVVEPVHGGLECGAFSEKNPALDMIAIGPSLRDVHSPQESCDIESVRVTAELLQAILERLA